MPGTFRTIISEKKWIFKGPFDIMKVKSYIEFCSPMWVLSGWALKAPEFSLTGSYPAAIWPWFVQGWAHLNWWEMQHHAVSHRCSDTRQNSGLARKKISYRHTYLQRSCLPPSYFTIDSQKPCQVMPANTHNRPACVTCIPAILPGKISTVSEVFAAVPVKERKKTPFLSQGQVIPGRNHH